MEKFSVGDKQLLRSYKTAKLRQVWGVGLCEENSIVCVGEGTL